MRPGERLANRFRFTALCIRQSCQLPALFRYTTPISKLRLAISVEQKKEDVSSWRAALELGDSACAPGDTKGLLQGGGEGEMHSSPNAAQQIDSLRSEVDRDLATS